MAQISKRASNSIAIVSVNLTSGEDTDSTNQKLPMKTDHALLPALCGLFLAARCLAQPSAVGHDAG